MLLLPSNLLALIYSSVLLSTTFAVESRRSSKASSLSDEITNVIPPCAQQCFISFIQANFPANACSGTPSLECLCSRNSTGGYTVGEGAVQCIYSEDAIGACKGENSTEVVMMRAYEMCLGQNGALPNTHATISATLVVQSSHPSVVLVDTTYTEPTVTTSSSTSSTRSATSFSTSVSTRRETPTGILTATGSPSIPTSSSGTPTQTSQASKVSETSQASSTPVAAASSGLSKPQVAGIAVGSVGGAALAIAGLLFFARYCRRRRREEADRDSDFFPFQTEPKPVAKKDPGGGPTEGLTGAGFNGAAQHLPPPHLISDARDLVLGEGEYAYSPGDIGVAISPDSTPQKRPLDRGSERKRSSKLLPDRPGLQVQASMRSEMPSEEPLRFPMPPKQTQPIENFYNPRESAMTQFEEEPNSPTEESGNYIRRHSRQNSAEPLSNTYRQPSTQRTLPPRLLTVPPTMVRPLEILNSQQTNVSQSNDPVRTTSSVYSDLESLPSARNNPKRRSSVEYAGWRPPIHNQPLKAYRLYRSSGRDRSDSAGSVTSIESNSGPLYSYAARGSGLHTIPATPNSTSSSGGMSPKGVSPVTYPDPNSFGHPAFRRAPPPAQPDFTRAPSVYDRYPDRGAQDYGRRMSRSGAAGQVQHVRAGSAHSVKTDVSSLAERRARPTPTLHIWHDDDPFISYPGQLHVRNPDPTDDPRQQAADGFRAGPSTPQVMSPTGVHLTPKLIGNDLYLHVG